MRMSEQKHTPGPWGQCNCMIYAVDDGEPIARCLGKEMHRAFSDANLIAAAPELLAALEVAVEYFDRNEIDCIAHDDAKAAIKKAKGE